MRNLHKHGFARVAAITVPVVPAAPKRNAETIIAACSAAASENVDIAVFPELALSGYAIDDLVTQDTLLRAVALSIEQILAASAQWPMLIILGAPLRCNARIYNCALTIAKGRILGATPKSYLPNYREFYEQRNFSSGSKTPQGSVDFLTSPCQIGHHIVHVEDLPGLAVATEICEDMWVPVPPGAHLALAGATVLANPSGSPITVGRARERELMVASASARNRCVYVYAASGPGESSNDLAWDGQTLICEDGIKVASSERFQHNMTITDVDIARLVAERSRQNTFTNHWAAPDFEITHIHTELGIDYEKDLGLRKNVNRFPFVPGNAAQLDQDCFEAFNIQVSALQRRMSAIGNPKLIIGVSGGLDSTHALLVAAQAMDRAGRDRRDILAFTMPGFATSEHTRSNAQELCESLGTSFEQIDIRPAATQMLHDMGHPYASGHEIYDVTFENVQAGLRTDYLFRLANHHGGIVIGTGDLSELALGWCTYGVGDQMSHYAVNCGVPKTLMQHLIRWVIARDIYTKRTAQVLESILNTEITPELIPTREGEKPQSTAASIGPYELHDFFLYHVLRYGAEPGKIIFLAEQAWSTKEGSWPPGYPDEHPTFNREEITQWLRVFYRRFFTNQFKRTAVPNGPKIMSGGALSPRGDWRMPSDASVEEWLNSIK